MDRSIRESHWKGSGTGRGAITGCKSLSRLYQCFNRHCSDGFLQATGISDGHPGLWRGPGHQQIAPDGMRQFAQSIERVDDEREANRGDLLEISEWASRLPLDVCPK